MQLIDLCIADTGFILVIVDDGERAGLGPSFVQTVQAAFDRELVADASPDLGPSLRLIRPNPRRLERRLDRDLLAAILADGEAATQAWYAWRARENLDEHLGFGEIASMLSENLNRLGIDDVDTGRINGLRRRAWYANQLIAREAAAAVDSVLQEGCDPILLGDLPAGLRAAETGSVRPVGRIDLCVPPHAAAHVADALTRLGWTPGRPGPLTESRLEWHTWQRFRMDPGRVLVLHWRPLPQRCSHLITAPIDDASDRVALHGVEVRTQSPTGQLLRLWARTGDAVPGHLLRTLCDTADLLSRSPRDIDWLRLWSDCGRLGLVEYGETYLGALPAGLGDAGIRELRRWNSERRP